MDDARLLRDYAERGSHEAFARLVQLHVDLVYSAALRRVGGDHHRAEEVTQMVFTDLARKACRLKDHPLLDGWLHGSTRWAAANLRRAEARRRANEEAAAQAPMIVPESEPPADWAVVAPLLDAALDSLGDKDRDAVLMRFFKNRSFAEIGTALGLSENAARMRVERALAKLHCILARRGVVSTSAALGLALTQNSVVAAPSSTASVVAAASLGGAATTGSGSAFAYFLMTKLQLTLAGAAAVSLSVGLSLQALQNHRLQGRLADLQARIDATRTATNKVRGQLVQSEATIRQLDETLAAQTLTLTPEQQERVRLDTIVRKGELDTDYAYLFRRLKLGAEPLDRFKTLLVERNQAVFDAIKLAKSQGVDSLSPSERRLIGESATEEVDRRIAQLLGDVGYAQFHEYLDVQPYLSWATVLVESGQGSEGEPAEVACARGALDEEIGRVAGILSRVGAVYFAVGYRGNGWPIVPPPEIREALIGVLAPQALKYYDEEVDDIKGQRRLCDIAREAAVQGRLRLSKSSARDYPTSAQPQSPATK